MIAALFLVTCLIFVVFVGLTVFHIPFGDFLKFKEGFDNVPASAFVPRIAPGGYEEDSLLSPGPSFNSSTETIVASAALPAMDRTTARANWGRTTSEHCYRNDIGESLKKTRNFLQRTNNYTHTHPDSCSAPNHEFVGTFYTPFDGVGRYPATGTQYPPSTMRCEGEPDVVLPNTADV